MGVRRIKELRLSRLVFLDKPGSKGGQLTWAQLLDALFEHFDL
jgi:hypothetical protein